MSQIKIAKLKAIKNLLKNKTKKNLVEKQEQKQSAIHKLYSNFQLDATQNKSPATHLRDWKQIKFTNK